MNRAQQVDRLASFLKQPHHLSFVDYCKETSKKFPTIGAEVEVPWRTILPNHQEWFGAQAYKEFSPTKKKEFDTLCNSICEEKEPAYQELTKFIPKDKDGFWEFAHKPVHWYKTLSEEIGLLLEKDFIKKGYNNPMHVTISDVQKTIDAGILTCVVEFLGGSNPARLQSAYNKEPWFGWNCKERDSGLRERKKEELSLEKETGIEISTLCAQSPEQVEQTLHNTQILAHSILSYQKNPYSFQGKAWSKIKQIALNKLLTPVGLNKWFESPSKNQEVWNMYCALFNNLSTQSIQQELQQEINYLSKHVLRI